MTSCALDVQCRKARTGLVMDTSYYSDRFGMITNIFKDISDQKTILINYNQKADKMVSGVC